MNFLFSAIISFLRAQAPVRQPVAPSSFNLLGRLVRSFFLTPVGPTRPVPAIVVRGPTVEYGEYLATSVANCAGCHTYRDMRTGEPIGEPFAGGFKMDEHVTPNLTPDPRTGRITSWSEDDFVARLRSGNGMPGTHMPWKMIARMTEDDLRAIYRFLRSLPPVDNDTGVPGA